MRAICLRLAMLAAPGVAPLLPGTEVWKSMSHPHSVMVLDDDPHVTTLIEEVLLFEGYRLRRAKGPHASLATIRQAELDLLVVELSLYNADPTMLLLDALRRDEATRTLAVLVSTTNPRLIQHLAAPLAHLRCEVLFKPFTLEALFDGVAQAERLAGERNVQEDRRPAAGLAFDRERSVNQPGALGHAH